MKKLTPAASGGPDAAENEGTSRRTFLQGTAERRGRCGHDPRHTQGRVCSRPPARAPALPSKGSCHQALRPRSGEPVTAYVHNAERGEVTVMSGTAGDDLQRPGAREAAARRSPLSTDL